VNENKKEISINYKRIFFLRFQRYIKKNLPYGCFFLLWILGNKTGQFITYKYILKNK
jgi:hypothetical protein